MTTSGQLVLTSIQNLPIIKEDDDLGSMIFNHAQKQSIGFEDGDIIVMAQKIVSKSEGRLRDLREVKPGLRARFIARKVQKDARLVELILQESNKVLRAKNGKLIVEHKKGFVCANAGIDHSNAIGGDDSSHYVLLLPEDADRSASKIRSVLELKTGKKIGVLIIDSHGRAWRTGTTGTTIGVAGVPALVDLRGTPDLFGYRLRITQVAAADELAAGASLMMGQAAEGTPCIHVRGFPYQMRESGLGELIRNKNKDLFR